MRLIRNPEIIRHAWLELGQARLFSVALIWAAIFALAWLMTDSYPHFLKVARTISTIGLVSLPGIWGTRLVVDSLAKEIHDRTWELQRMTPLSPAEMTLGKLVGGPVFAWCAGAMLAVPFVFSTWGLEGGLAGIRHLFHLLLGILLFHGLGLTVTLAGVRKARAWNSEMPRAMPFYLLLAFGIFIWIGGSPLSHFLGARLTWYGFPVDASVFLTGSLVFWAFWAVFGAHRSMRRELQMGGLPWCWTVFLLTAMAHAAGFDGLRLGWELGGDFPSRGTGGLLQAGGVGVLAAYGAMFAEVKDPVEERRFLAAVETGNWRTAGESLPLWIVPAAMTGGICAALTLTNFRAGLALFPLAVYLFLLRDMALILLANRTARPRRADATAAVWLLLLYVLCPMIVGASGNVEWIGFFLPVPTSAGFFQIFVVFCQAAAAWAFLFRRSGARAPERR